MPQPEVSLILTAVQLPAHAFGWSFLRESDVGNPHVRFDEGRGCRACGITSSPTLPTRGLFPPSLDIVTTVD